MPDERITQIEAGLQSRPYKGRQALYRFLREDHARFLAMFERTDASWRTIAEETAKTGVMGKTGNPPTRETIRRVWIRVCRDIAAEKAAADMERLTGIRPAANGRKKAPANWLPSGYPQPNAPSPTGDEHQGSASAALPAVLHQQPATPATPDTPKEPRRRGSSLDRVRELMNARSGRKPNGEPLF